MPNPPQIQYQARAQALGPPPPVTSVDKWYVQHPGPTVNRLAVAAIAAGMVQCPIPPTVRSPAEWMPREQPAYPVRAIPRPQGWQVADPLLVMVPSRPEAWMPRPMPDWPLEPAPRPLGWQVIDPLLVPNPPRAEIWQYPPQDPSPTPPRPPGWITTDALLVPRPPKAEAWAQPQQANPVAARRAPEFAIGGNWTATQQASISLFYADAWQYTPPVPSSVAQRNQGWYSTDALLVPKPAKPDDWAYAAQVPSRVRQPDFTASGGIWTATQQASVTFFFAEAWQYRITIPQTVPARPTGQQFVAPLSSIGPKPDAFQFHQPDAPATVSPRRLGQQVVAPLQAIGPKPDAFQFHQPDRLSAATPRPAGLQLVDPHYVYALPRVSSWEPALSQPRPARPATWIYGASVSNVTFVSTGATSPLYSIILTSRIIH